MSTDNYIVHVVDDEEAVRKSLAFLLTMSGLAVKMHESAAAFLAAAPGIPPGVLVTDLRMPDMNGVELLSALRDAGAMMPAIVVTGHADVPMAVAAMKAGALDFIEKPYSDEVLIAAIQRAAAEIETASPAGEDTAAILGKIAQLSDRERQVLSAVVTGLPNKTIAYNLDISPRTVEVHRANVMAKMQARSLPELVRMVMAVEAPAK
ncbi:response regulator FixJ [Radicibacter daui]|uniref:response regulator FixJ n=1 Tax=Radicibacter daui TaxID=3064829 RepID=UPI004046C3E4